MMITPIEKLKELGRMPDQDLDNDSPSIQEVVEKYEQLLDEMEEPLSMEEGRFLLSILPSTKFYGLEEYIISKVETIELNDEKSMKEYEELMNSCPNEEVKSFLIAGYENWRKQECL